jgi:hypothetical protein
VIVPGKTYTKTQLQEQMDAASAEQLKMTGYVLQYDILNETYTVVHWTKAAGAMASPTKNKVERLASKRMAHDPFAFTEAPPPIVRRTPMERVDSMMLRLIDDCKRTGTVPLVSDDRIKAILGERWRAGKTDLTAEDIRTVASHLLARAEQQRKVDDFNKVADLNPSN